MSNTLDQERREFEELCKNNPNYPKDFELHKMYQGHIKKWKPLIESNDPIIYSDWKNFVPIRDLGYPTFNDDLYKIDHLIGDYNLSHPGRWSDYRVSINGLALDHWDRVRPTDIDNYISKPKVFSETIKDRELRRSLMIYVYESYVHRIENMESNIFNLPKSGRYDVFRTYKPDFIDLFNRMEQSNNNPFDVLFFVKGDVYNSQQNTNFIFVCLFIVIMVVFIGFAVAP